MSQKLVFSDSDWLTATEAGVLAALKDRGRLNRAAWTVLSGCHPIRASYTFRDLRQRELVEFLDCRGIVMYRLSTKGELAVAEEKCHHLMTAR